MEALYSTLSPCLLRHSWITIRLPFDYSVFSFDFESITQNIVGGNFIKITELKISAYSASMQMNESYEFSKRFSEYYFKSYLNSSWDMFMCIHIIASYLTNLGVCFSLFEAPSQLVAASGRETQVETKA